MRILGIDPGYAIVGYGVLNSEKGIHTPVDYGVITTSKEESTPVRLKIIADAVDALIDKYQPECIAVEELFYFSNQKTVIKVAEARGVILAVAINKCGRLFEFTPLQVKQAITGYGRADKKQMQQMIKVLLKLKEVPRPDDAADALAVALCCAQTQKMSPLYSI